jgi:signal transduction histidine kinase
MRMLPAIPSVAWAGNLPLAPGSAVVLAHWLVSGPCRCAVEQFSSALAVDPALTLWAVAGAHAAEWEVSGLSSAADWLHGQSATALRWDRLPPDWNGLDPVELAELAAESAVLAEAAARVARALGGDTQRATLVGVLRDWDRWLAPSEGVGPEQYFPSLPVWLREEIERSGQPGAPWEASPGGCVALARDLLAGVADPPAGFKWGKADRLRLADRARRNMLDLHQASDWLPELASRLARLEALECSFDERLEAEKLEAMAELAAGAGHEMNNPLAVISGRVQLFLRDEHDPERRRELAIINTQSLRVHEMIADMMLFARPPRPRIEPVDIIALVDQLLADLAPLAEERSIAMTRDAPPESLLVAGDRVQLLVALRAVMDNALRAIGREGRIEVSIRGTNRGERPIEISVRDNGPGIPPEVRRHLFDPFYSGREAGRGLGMGLAKCWRIVSNHRGRIEVRGDRGQGTQFVIHLPGANRECSLRQAEADLELGGEQRA